MANVLSQSRRSLATCLRFTAAACAVLTVPLAFLAFAPPGRWVVGTVFDIRGPVLEDVILYLRWLTPLLLINGLRQFCTGLLIQASRTVVVTALNGVYLTTVVGVLVAGFTFGWGAVPTLAGAQGAAAILHLLLSAAFLRRWRPTAAPGEDGPLTYRQAFAYFWPVALTSTMFALSRPIIYSFASRSPNAEENVAAMRVAFDLAMVFHQPLNQARHLFATFGLDDLPSLRRFMATILAVSSAIMVVVAATPAGDLLLSHLLGVHGRLAHMAGQVLWVLCLVPFVVVVRNYFHGLALVRRRTGPMAAGGLCRVAVILLASWVFFSAGHLNHRGGAFVLVLGFAAEAVSVMAFGTWRRKGNVVP